MQCPKKPSSLHPVSEAFATPTLLQPWEAVMSELSVWSVKKVKRLARIAKPFTLSCSWSVRCKLLHCDALHRGFPGCHMDSIESVQAMSSMLVVWREIR